MARPWEMDWSNTQPVNPYSTGPDPERVRRMQEEEARRQRDEARANAGLGLSQQGEVRQQGNDQASRLTKLSDAYNGDQTVKAYRIAIAQLGQALNTGSGPQSDLALTYAFAKAMDPESVVREAEQNMVTDSQPWFQTMVERTKKQFGMDGAGNYTPEARQALRIQISNAVAQRAKVYDARRNYYQKQASALGVDPTIVIGEHDAKPFVPVIQQWVEQSKPGGQELTREQQQLYDAVMAANPNATPDQLRGVFGQAGLPVPANLDEIVAVRDRTGGVRSANDAIYQEAPSDQWQAPGWQGMSGINRGIANSFGMVRDIPNAIDTGMTRGINALFGTDLKTADEAAQMTTGEDSLGSSGWWQNRFGDANFTGPAPTTPGGAFANRVGESIGAALMPVGGAGVSAGKAAMGLTAAAGGGVGAATAQQAFPGNPAAEFAGEMIGSAGTGLGMARVGQRQGQRAVEAAVPTVADLKTEARQLYQAAEARGVVIRPAQTKRLAADMRRTLAQQGRVSPTGRLSEVYPKAKEAMQLVQDYAGKPMTPTQLQVVREVVADGLTSQDKSEQRIAGLLLDTFDTWAEPFAPELPAARQVASRYLQTQQLEQARELAEAQASQFSGSGIENALRTQYRALDRNQIKGRARFAPEVADAIQTVSRGTPASNAARTVGKLAPRGVMSFGLGTGAPAAVGAMLGGPGGAAIAGGGALALGEAGRAAATRMALQNATRAEMIARNGQQLSQVPLMSPETERLLLALAASQGVNGQRGYEEPGNGLPNPFAGTEYQPRRGLFGGLR